MLDALLVCFYFSTALAADDRNILTAERLVSGFTNSVIISALSLLVVGQDDSGRSLSPACTSSWLMTSKSGGVAFTLFVLLFAQS